MKPKPKSLRLSTWGSRLRGEPADPRVPVGCTDLLGWPEPDVPTDQRLQPTPLARSGLPEAGAPRPARGDLDTGQAPGCVPTERRRRCFSLFADRPATRRAA